MMTLFTIMILMAAFAAGLALGAFYFMALWQTVKRLSSTTSPARLMLGSLALRMAVLTIGFYFVMGGHWERMAAAMLGFVVMRKILTYRLGPPRAMEAVH
ncbi:MAG: ATP synthase subunit I [Deltaproteobacteria bacterium]